MEKETEKIEVVAGVLLFKDNKFLLVQEGRGPKKGLWNWPAGKVDKGDNIEQTAVKEAKEESGFDVSLIKEIGIFHKDITRPVAHLFYAEIIGGELKIPADEIMNAGWFSLDELKKFTNLRAEWILDGIEIFNKTRG
ncbi:MAG: NUDIX domain-containing protein [Candidatus Paceibacterota bacterium]